MNSFLINYLIIGVMVTLVFEMLGHQYMGQTFTMGERIVSFLLWPIGVLVFISSMFK